MHTAQRGQAPRSEQRRSGGGGHWAWGGGFFGGAWVFHLWLQYKNPNLRTAQNFCCGLCGKNEVIFEGKNSENFGTNQEKQGED